MKTKSPTHLDPDTAFGIVEVLASSSKSVPPKYIDELAQAAGTDRKALMEHFERHAKMAKAEQEGEFPRPFRAPSP